MSHSNMLRWIVWRGNVIWCSGGKRGLQRERCDWHGRYGVPWGPKVTVLLTSQEVTLSDELNRSKLIMKLMNVFLKMFHLTQFLFILFYISIYLFYRVRLLNGAMTPLYCDTADYWQLLPISVVLHISHSGVWSTWFCFFFSRSGSFIKMT